MNQFSDFGTADFTFNVFEPGVEKLCMDLVRDGRRGIAIQLLQEGFKGLSGSDAWKICNGELTIAQVRAKWESEHRYDECSIF